MILHMAEIVKALCTFQTACSKKQRGIETDMGVIYTGKKELLGQRTNIKDEKERRSSTTLKLKGRKREGKTHLSFFSSKRFSHNLRPSSAKWTDLGYMTYYLKAPNNYTAQVGAPPEHSKTVKKRFAKNASFCLIGWPDG